MPEQKDFAPLTGRYLRYVWDTTGTPEVQQLENAVMITPQFANLTIYGREVKPDPKDELNGRILGEWFSIACLLGEVGTVPSEWCELISAEEFSAAYTRNWEA
jgi:hypothetical protein